ncbi:MAG: hypothetical protein PWQ55_999 [Chloroflexota bacterium]|nr:hypothetical protein [Chloroflexota bacterium]
MTGTNKSNKTVLDGLKDLLGGAEKKTEETPAKKTSVTSAKASASKTSKPASGTVKPSAAKPAASKPSKEAQDSLKAYKEDQVVKKQLEVLHSKTHQDLINAAYKAAETLGIAPWVLLRAAGWGHFTDDRGKKYDGPAIDEIEGLEAAQKKALKDVLGL